MKRITWTLRSMVGILLVVLGLIIVGRGVIQSAPFAYVAMGGLMVVLGVYRLRIMFGYGRQR